MKDLKALAIMDVQFDSQSFRQLLFLNSLTEHPITHEEFDDGSVKINLEGSRLSIAMVRPEAGVMTLTLLEQQTPEAFNKWASHTEVVEACRWLTQLAHGQGKAGGPFEPGEWEDAVGFAEKALSEYEQL